MIDFQSSWTDEAELPAINQTSGAGMSSPGGEYSCWVLHNVKFGCSVATFHSIESRVNPYLQAYKSEPQSTNVAQGQDAIFSATVGGIGPFHYQWQLNGTNISGAIYSSYVIMTVPPDVSVSPTTTNLVWVEGSSSITDSVFGVIANDGQPYSYITNISWSASGPGTATFLPANSLAPSVTFSTNGSYLVTLSVDNGYATGSATCTVNIERHPQIHFNAPTNNPTVLTGQSLALSVSVFPYDGTITNVIYSTNTAPLGPGIQSLNHAYTYLWQNPTLGTNLISAVAYCDDGLTSTATITNVLVPPLAVWFVAPTNNQLFIISPTNIFLTALVTDYVGATSINVVFTNQTQSIGLGAGTPQTNSTYQLLWEDVTNGTNTITVTASDNLGNVATNAISVIVNAMPAVSIISPTNLQLFVEVTNVTLEATNNDTDGSVTDVQFYAYSIATNNLLADLTNANGGGNLYEFTWTNIYAGRYPVYAVATDNRGASTVSIPVDFVVTPTNLPPTVEITYPTNNAVFPDGADFTITAVATNGSAPVTNVEFFVNGEDVGSDPNPPYEINECCWKPGTYQLTAIAMDNLGASAVSSNVVITIESPAPVSQGFWDPQFSQSAINFLYNVVGNPLPPGESFALSTIGTNQTVYVGAEYAMFAVTDGTNWSVSPFPFGAGADDLPNPGGEWEDIPYNAILTDNTNVYVFGPTNLEWTDGIDDTYYRDDFRLLEQEGNGFIPLGTGFCDSGYYYTYILDLIKFDGDIYACGNFNEANPDCNTNIAYVAKYDISNNDWDPVGNILNGPVLAMAVFDGNLYIGGSFTSAGGNTNISYVAYLSGNVWTNLGSGVSIRPPYTNEEYDYF
jgi:hypothetical protein